MNLRPAPMTLAHKNELRRGSPGQTLVPYINVTEVRAFGLENALGWTGLGLAEFKVEVPAQTTHHLGVIWILNRPYGASRAPSKRRT